MTLIINIRNESKPGGYFSIAECGGIVVRKTKGGSIHELARKLQLEGVDREALVTVQRGALTVFSARPLWQWADFALHEPDGGPMRLAKWNYEAQAKFAEQRRKEKET